MQVAILHCHFERGGVTQVVENHMRFLSGCYEVEQTLLISGQRTGGLSDATRAMTSCACVEAMEYDALLNPTGSVIERGNQLAGEIAKTLAANGFQQSETVLHWHNHSLGKNVAAPIAIARLAAAGWRILLQVHDFAEDNRPSNYAAIISGCDARSKQDVDAYLYPRADQIHYASLTVADLQVFIQLGMARQQTHCLPNSVTPANDESVDREAALAIVRQAFGLPSDARWCLYPVRGIRRKNVGELLLISRLLPDNAWAGITLEPATPVEAKSYRRWQALAETVAPKTVFNAGHHDDISFAVNVAASDIVISTSVAEGFGMVFLEPWLMGRSVVARKLPTVAADFQASGIEFPLLYDSMPVPGDPSWVDACVAETQAAETDAWSAVAERFRPDGSCVVSQDATIDFAKLTPARQMQVLRRMASDAGFQLAVQQSCSTLVDSLSQEPGAKLIESNQQRVSEYYSPTAQGRTLLTTYQCVLTSAVSDVVGSAVDSLSADHSAEHSAEHSSAAGDRLSAVDCVSAVRPFYPCRTEVPPDV